MKTCYIVGAGEFYGSFKPNKDDLVIAADGGYSVLKEKGIRCDLLIGDMDSIKDTPNDIQAIGLYNQYKDEADRLTKDYENKYGKICLGINENYTWDWNNSPWPWEKK